MLMSKLFRSSSVSCISSLSSRCLSTKSPLSLLLRNELDEETDRGSFLTEEFKTLQKRILKSMTLHESDGDMKIQLIQNLSNEIITVQFECEAQEPSEYEDDQEEEDDKIEDAQVHNEDENEDENDLGFPSIPFTVTIKKNDDCLIFDCLASESLEIEGIRMEGENTNSNTVPYDGPSFMELDLDVQDGFMTYLEDRAITDDVARFIQEFSENKEQKEYVRFLAEVSKFTE